MGLTSKGKIRLKRTCREEQVQWFEDPTNQDPSFTRRNAIRTLLFSKNARSRLPRALQKPALLGLAQRVAEAEARISKRAERILSKLDFRFGPGTGTLQTELPIKGGETLDTLRPERARVLLRVLTIIAEKASPLLKIKRHAMIGVLSAMFNRPQKSPLVFTAAGLSWIGGAGGVWTLRRVPHTTRSRLEATVGFELGGPGIWSDWKLWDGRWWMRIRATGTEVDCVVVRPLSQIETKQLKMRLMQLGRDDVLDELRKMRGNSLFTVPVLALAVEEGTASPDGVFRQFRERPLLGLPTFDVHLLKRRHESDIGERLVEWEIAFKTPIP